VRGDQDPRRLPQRVPGGQRLGVGDVEGEPESRLARAPTTRHHRRPAGGTTAMLPRMAALARHQVERYVAGRDLRNVVHRPE